MQVYKITFVNNDILHIASAPNKVFQGEYVYEYYNGYLIYALVNADNEEQAQQVGEKLAQQFKQV